ncbi:MAG: DUF3108 domain-containing protein [Polaromonas sp.]|uniref:DUF3108 domain-containing protein n=1 Tax=Polaromonas sp. TaxID=1869339 RepID=UPI002736B41E|nr:DUF3108 domain-containing protein [Polaromonas sp.]MDP2817500.1 DUF3108 domain-containing protein [Polaromonas sp.]
MNALTAQPSAAPPLRPLLVLTSAVVLAHVLLLQAAPAHWGMEAEPPLKLRPLITRSIDIKPPQPTATLAAPPPPVRRAAAAVPRLQQNTAPALSAQAPAAIESIAPPVPEPVVANTPPPSLVPEPRPPTAEAAPAAPVAAAAALTIPGSMRLKYSMTGRSRNMDYHAAAQLDWLQDGEAYQASMVVSAFGLGERSMASRGHITGDGLAPTRFLDKSRSERAAHFQPDKGKITFSANTPDVPWQPGAQDRASVFVQLASLLAGDPAKYPVGSSVSLYTVGPTGADTWTFVVEAEEKLNLPAGEFGTVKLTRKPQRDYDQAVEAWLAPSLAWLPARIRITQHNGDFVDQQLRVAEKPL